MAVTYEPLATTTLTSGQTSVTFSSISGSYTDLVLVCSGYASTNGYSPRLQFNNDTSTNYSHTNVGGNGTSASSDRRSNQTFAFIGWLAAWDNSSSNISNNIVHIMNYSNTTTYKTILSRDNVASAAYPGTEALVAMWRSTSAITSIKLLLDASATFQSGSTFTLYGIKAA